MKKARIANHPNSLSSTRKKLGWTQQQMADELQLSRCAITLIEQGKRSLSTTSLLKLATLEMRQDKPVEQTTGTALPEGVHYVIAKSKRSCSALLVQEANCRLKSHKLSQALEQMIAQHERLNLWMKMAANTIESPEIKRQKLAVQTKLDKCGLPAQGLLRHEISLMDAQAELYCNMQKHLQNELAIHFNNNE